MNVFYKGDKVHWTDVKRKRGVVETKKAAGVIAAFIEGVNPRALVCKANGRCAEVRVSRLRHDSQVSELTDIVNGLAKAMEESHEAQL